MNRRPSGYEGVSAKTSWTNRRQQHGMDDISAYSSVFQPDLSNWCADVFPVVGQNVGQATMQKTQGVLAAYHHFSLPAALPTSPWSLPRQNTVPWRLRNNSGCQTDRRRRTADLCMPYLPQSEAQSSRQLHLPKLMLGALSR